MADEKRDGVNMKLVAIIGTALTAVLGILSTVLVLLVKSFVTQMEVQHKDNMAMQAVQHVDNMASQIETRKVLTELGNKQQTLSETIRKVIDKKKAPTP